MNQQKEQRVESEIGKVSVDQTGAAIGVSRLDPSQSYKEVGGLLKGVIEASDPKAWSTIKAKINYTYENLDRALSALEQEEGFVAEIRERISRGQKILFKPNVVSGESINPYNHLPVPGTYANTEWSYVAAIMRWFHDKAGISYYQMSIGEAATTTSMRASQYSCVKGSGRPVTTEAVYEGRSDDFYGGWGFYFVRLYLAEESVSELNDDPMRGLEESMAGTFIPPGEVDDKLMVYDINKISDDPSKGREIEVPDGENFPSIVLHKTIVGGDPADPEDRRRYPGCILINLPKLKVHSQALITNAIKNLGIGLYSMQAQQSDGCCWKYATPDTRLPSMKSKIPHQVWVPEMDMETLTPKKDENGEYIVRKTGGLTGTMLDIIRAVASQDIFMMHIIDAIEVVNRDHQGLGLGIAEPEGLIVAGCDVVSVDLFCARYLFSNVGLKEAETVGLDDGLGGCFPQAVPVPHHQSQSIVTASDYDSPIARDRCFQKAVAYGIGSAEYHVAGWDSTSDTLLVSVKGRLGSLSDGTFRGIHTGTLYWDMFKMPWDLQKTFFGYLEAAGEIEKENYKQLFLDAFDENGDSTVTYEEFGKKGICGPPLFLGGLYMSLRGEKEEADAFRSYYAMIASPLRGASPDWNGEQHHFNREAFLGSVTVVAWMMSQMPKENQDQHFPDLQWGNGKWPSFKQARDAYLYQVIYGWKFPKKIGMFSLYGSALAYADLQQNNRQFIGNLHSVPNPNAPASYMEAVQKKETEPLDFTLFVPPGYGAHGKLMHVKETTDPARAFTAEFEQGRIRWPDARESIAG